MIARSCCGQAGGTVTAAAAEHSGTAVVRITHNRRLWAGTTIRWHGKDLAVTSGFPRRPGPGPRFLVVDGTMYGIDPSARGWVKLGGPENIDPDSGTTPAEYLAAVREDVGGVTLQVLPFGYVAHDQAANPAAPLHVAVTVNGRTIREIAVSWGADASAWTYTVTYSRLGATPAPVAPRNARPLREVLRAGKR